MSVSYYGYIHLPIDFVYSPLQRDANHGFKAVLNSQVKVAIGRCAGGVADAGKPYPWDLNKTSHLLSITVEMLSGEIAAHTGDFENAIAHLQMGVTLEDQLSYTEPALWAVPVRQTLGTVLLRANRPAEAEQTYREDLVIYPENGWSLEGLARSLEVQGKEGV